MTYKIKSIRLRYHGRTTEGPAGLVYSKSDITEFINDFIEEEHTTAYMLMSPELTKEYEQYRKDEDSQFLKSLGGLLGGFLTVNPTLVGYNGSKLIGDLVSTRYKTDPFDRVSLIHIWDRNNLRKYDCDRLGVIMASSLKG